MWTTLTEDALTSKKFLVWLATVIIAFGNAVLARVAPGYEMDPALVWQLVATAAAYTVGQGIADHGKAATEKQVQLGAAQQLEGGPQRSAVMSALAGVSPSSIKSADIVATALPGPGEAAK